MGYLLLTDSRVNIDIQAQPHRDNHVCHTDTFIHAGTGTFIRAGTDTFLHAGTDTQRQSCMSHIHSYTGTHICHRGIIA